ncbi:hypothetical protein RJ639_001299 [Escallonia herrerae]|uniref:Bifunctional inhibitor/plant lipid transfer protein/seed storage helical domain-containing protein n=1 Tax=Escallonia herrerae TaxID=1293975 RepID=A0AA89BFS5_9ASTE|nr:hypothetical protein RJ639_001299 [Escallonia herrerae]
MAGQGIEMGLVLVLVTMLWTGAAAQSCTNVIISMSPCLNYISGNSSTPSSGCCTQLATVVKSQPQCLCQVLNGGGSSLGLNINQTQALALPGACKYDMMTCKHNYIYFSTNLYSLKPEQLPLQPALLQGHQNLQIRYLQVQKRSIMLEASTQSFQFRYGFCLNYFVCSIHFRTYSFEFLNRAGRGTNTVPSTDSGSSDGTSTKVAAHVLFFLLFVASYASTFTMG